MACWQLYIYVQILWINRLHQLKLDSSNISIRKNELWQQQSLDGRICLESLSLIIEIKFTGFKEPNTCSISMECLKTFESLVGISLDLWNPLILQSIMNIILSMSF